MIEEILQPVIDLIQTNIDIAPYLVFALLILAGFNLPISEDLLIAVTGVIAAAHPHKIPILLFFLWLGVYFSDIICFFMGRLLGNRFQAQNKFLFIKRDKLQYVQHHLNKYGLATFVVGRFIPFGVRNAIFLSAGISKMPIKKFVFFDFAASTISVVSSFTLVFFFGKAVFMIYRRYAIFLLPLSVVLILITCYTWSKIDRGVKEDAKIHAPPAD